MLLNEIKLKNFRQYINQDIKFSADIENNKNVTIVMGEIGTGKTTLAQAFRWCFYGETDFADSNLLNYVVARELENGSSADVEVTVNFIHRQKEYEITRKIKCTKNSNGKITQSRTSFFELTYKDEKSITHTITDPSDEINEILPKAISKYFFFDGERMGNISKQIAKGKGTEFGEAVKNLLGLTAFTEAIDHLNGKSKQNTVVKYFEKQYSSKSNSDIERIRTEMDEINQKRQKNNEDIIKCNKDIDIAQENVEKYASQLRENDKSKELQEKREDLVNKNKSLEYENVENTRNIVKLFNQNSRAWYLQSLLSSIKEELDKSYSIDKGIPDITAKTIEYLLKNKRCICGDPIEFGSKEYDALNDLLNYVPPKAIGTMISEFSTECNRIIKNETAKYLYDMTKVSYAKILGNQTDYQDNLDIIDDISETLHGTPDVSSIQGEYNRFLDQLNVKNDDLKDYHEKKGALESDFSRKEKELTNLALLDEKNKISVENKVYAEYIYEIINENYKTEEIKTRQELERAVDRIFKYIYNGGFSLSLDERYNIIINSTELEDFNENIETSTGQSMSVLFAFITGVIEIARKNQKEKESRKLNSGSNLEEEAISEAYPLVMDAPLSAFSKKTIKNICNSIPSIAEQVIIFIKDTDGDIATEYLSDRVEYTYQINKENEFVAKIDQKGGK